MEHRHQIIFLPFKFRLLKSGSIILLFNEDLTFDFFLNYWHWLNIYLESEGEWLLLNKKNDNRVKIYKIKILTIANCNTDLNYNPGRFCIFLYNCEGDVRVKAKI